MIKGNKKLTSRVRNLVVVCTLAAIVLSASTYAWFIGMRTVNVSSFDVEIAATDSLLLSIDGETWDTTVAINKDNYSIGSYDGNTNSWGDPGLIPMSTIGDMDVAASRMKIFEKASLTATPGGYRLMSSRIDNYNPGEGEKRGYVAFDLFIRNFSGTQYLPELNTLDEEAIYLNLNSKVKVATGGVEDTGIENSVRVAFAQIGRVNGTTTTPTTITGITCNDDGNGNPSVIDAVTGICRKAQIWEPNDIKHVANAISWYNTSCKKRKADGANITLAASYDLTETGNCSTVSDTVAYPTYSVGSPINSSDNVDIYDGLKYNTYTSSALLVDNPTFTDTYKEKTGTQRPLFMTLAPNSITKVRVYIYIEGQDVDNYDFASIGKKISVEFGFTKERFEGSDISYNGPVLKPGTDTTKPVITLLGNAEETVAVGGTYIDAGATASDYVDEDTNLDLTTKIHTINPVDTTKAGVYIVTYDVSDWEGNYAARVTRKVTVQ
ncbi:MAG: immunoglobulin-like domain-containing protein [Ignavibacteriales bacterium]